MNAHLLAVVALLAGHSALAASNQPAAATSAPTAGPRFEPEIRAFAEADRLRPPVRGGILFVGSSSFRLWTNVAEQLAPLPVLNRAFGGSHTGDQLTRFDQVVAPYAPRVIVYYCGSNDLKADHAPDAVFAHFRTFSERVQRTLPRTRLVFVSATRSPDRVAKWDRVDRYNGLVRDYCAATPQRTFVDLNPRLLGSDGQPRLDYYQKDLLHLSPPAYTELAAMLKPLLTRVWEEAVAVTPVALHLGADPDHRLGLRLLDQVLVESPPEGLWSVATDWADGWPTAWVHAHPSKIWQEAEWTRVTGAIELPQGRLALADSYRWEGDLLRGTRRFIWHGKSELPRVTLSVRWVLPGATDAKPLLPGIVYYGNPSGARTGAGAVAVHAGAPGDTSLFEEHRYAAPFACVEWPAGDSFRSAALHTVPSLLAGGRHADQWWSLGVTARETATELTLLSGPCTANGQRSVVKALQQKFLPYPEAWVNLRPGAVVEKTFFVEVCPQVGAGAGFRTPLRTALRLHPPFSLEGLPTFDQVIRDKYRFALSRFRDRPTDPGFEMYPDSVEGTHYVMGWCGQAGALGGALLRLAPRLGDPEAVNRAVRSMDLLATAPFNDHGFLLRYTAETRKWSEQDPVSQGQAMENFARAILAARARGGLDTTPWEAFLRQACAIQAARILRDDWRPVSTAEAFYVSPLCRAAQLFDEPEFRRAALKAAEHYAQRHLDLREPYWGGTLDARCEDKEGALAGFQAFLAVYELTRETRYLDWAAHALDVALTYTVLWDLDLPAGRLRDHGLKTRGWTIVSAQNQHLDVYAVLFTPEIWRMGDYLGRPELKRLAAVMFRSCGQLIDAEGSQGEQIQQTNFGQSGDLTDVFRMRGGYSEHWTVFWITAHFLNAAAQFEAMGVDLDRVE